MVMVADRDGHDGEPPTPLSARRVTIERWFDLGRAAWPDLALGIDEFTAYFERHATVEGPACEDYAPDIFLACACACAIDGAVPAFQRAMGGDMVRAIASIEPSQMFVDEVAQATYERLFVRSGGEPGKIVKYSGRGSLRSWIVAVAVRSAINQQRDDHARRRAQLRMEDDRCMLRGGPDFDYLRGRYQGAFQEAVRRAVGRLPPKERLILRLNLVDGMSIDRLGVMYRVGRSTAARWLADARRMLVARTRRELRAELQVTSSELDSVAADMRSQLHASLLRLLGGASRG